MADEADPPLPAQRLVERVTEFTDDDLHALCEATAAAIIDGGGFGWVSPPGMMALETYFRGVLLVPERELFVARLNGLVVGSAHLVRPPRNNEAQGHAAHLMHAYIAPYARGHGLARMLTIERRGARARTRLSRAEPRRARDPGGGDPALRNTRLRALGRASGLRLRARPGGARLLLQQATAPPRPAQNGGDVKPPSREGAEGR